MPSVIPGRVSVVIPCYNVAKFVRRAIDSALSQSEVDVEVIVVDDASSDDLKVQIDGYNDQIKFVRHASNGGVSRTRNTGVENATGEFLAFLDADDWWPEGFLSQCLSPAALGRALCYDNYIVSETDQPKFSPSSAQVQPKFSPSSAQVQPKFSPSSAQVQPKFSPSLFSLRLSGGTLS